MKNIWLIVLMIGMCMNSYGMDREGESLSNELRKPLSNRRNHPNIPDLEKPYSECSQHIKAEKEQARRKGLKEGRWEEKISTAVTLLKMGLSDEQIIQATRLTVEQLADLKQEKEKQID